ncbi:hypothetical protein IMSAG185_00082 [Lachnospiraceae bacterium]|nr:hypothetical protein IMSAG185_00082 [Lachnospiraceae bacterium]
MVDCLWDTSRTVFPSRSSCRDFKMTASFRLSRLLVGSSRSRKGASCKNALASPSRCRSPPERVSPSSPTGVSYPPGRLIMNSWTEAFLQAAIISPSAASGFAIRRLFLMLSWNRWVSCVIRLSISRKSKVLILATSLPEILILPPCTSQNRMNSFSSVDFPLPLFPTSPMIFPFGISSDTPSSTSSLSETLSAEAMLLLRFLSISFLSVNPLSIRSFSAGFP